jgi:acyl-CoA hydrolase
MSRTFRDADELAGAVLAAVGREIVLGLPVGIGKGVRVANALYERAAADPAIQLDIFTGLTFEAPAGRTELESRFIEPLAERLYADWPALRFLEDLRRGALPANVRVREFYFRPAAYLGLPLAQQSHTSINYSQVAGELERLGVNVIAQLVSARPESPGVFSLSSNPEVTLDLLSYLDERRERGAGTALVAEVNRRMPYMTGSAELAADGFDLVLDDGGPGFPPFGVPSRAVGPGDYATGMHVASLIPDGGTLQIGIGSLSDAVAHCLRLRHERPEVFEGVLERLPGGGASPRRAVLPLETGPFKTGLYACSELLSDALFSLFSAGIVRRPADEDDQICVHGGFFVGSSALYEALRALPEEDRARIDMTSISFVNTLFGDEEGKRRQRRGARFINETMMVTLLGAAVSDALEDGRVVSGVGGQFDFVSQAQALEDGMSILMVRARRRHEGRTVSNILWSYGHVTVPRHHRDLYVSEYGIAATGGATDADVIAAILGIADLEFQPALLAEAKASGKIAADYAPGDEAARNTPEALREIFTDPEVAPHFPRYPLGSVLTPVERDLADALTWLKDNAHGPLRRLGHVLRALPRRPAPRHAECLARLGLQSPAGIEQRVLRRLVAYALERSTP